MRKARTIFRVLLIACVLSGIAHAQDAKEEKASPSFAERFKERFYMSGTLEIEAAIETRGGDPQKFEWQLQPEFEIALPHDFDLTIIPRLRIGWLDELDPGQPHQDAISGVSRRLFIGESIDIELREFYLQKALGGTFLTLGKQQVVWGQADGLKVLDVVNPQDYREFIMDDFDDSRIPLWMVNVEVPIKNANLQLLWIPDQTYHQIPEEGAAYRITAQLPSSLPGIATKIAPVDRPARVIRDSDVGARLSGFYKGWDLTLNYLYHYDDRPVLYREIGVSPAGLTVFVNPSYERTHLIGASFSNAFGNLTLRGELGYAVGKHYSTGNLFEPDGIVESDEFAYVLGFDWFGIEETFLSVQLFQSFLTDDAPGLVRKPSETNVSLNIKRDFKNDTMALEALWVHSATYGDGLIRPKISYQMNDNLNLWAGVDYFYGTKNGLFGQFDHRDRVVLGMEWGF